MFESSAISELLATGHDDATAIAALNPAYRLEEFDFYLSDLGKGTALVERNSTSPATEAAAAITYRSLK